MKDLTREIETLQARVATLETALKMIGQVLVVSARKFPMEEGTVICLIIEGALEGAAAETTTTTTTQTNQQP